MRLFIGVSLVLGHLPSVQALFVITYIEKNNFSQFPFVSIKSPEANVIMLKIHKELSMPVVFSFSSTACRKTHRVFSMLELKLFP